MGSEVEMGSSQSLPVADAQERAVSDITPSAAVAFLDAAAKYFERRPILGEDAAYWANYSNAQNCRRIAGLIRRLDDGAPSRHTRQLRDEPSSSEEPTP